MNNKNLSVTILFLLLFGCASPYVVEEKQLGDADLSCEAIKEQIAESENGYYSQFWVEASKFEVKECDHDHDHAEGEENHDYTGKYCW